MAINTKVHGIYPAVKVNTEYIDQVSSMRIPPGVQRMLLSDGVYNLFNAVQQQDPRIQFGTSALATALGIAGAEGEKIVATSNEIDFWLRKRDEAGLYAGATSHIQITGHNGILYPRSLRATLAGASMEYEYIPTYDGSNNPLVFTTSADLAGTPTIDEAFVVGPVYVNGTQLEGVQSVDIDFNFAFDLVFADGGVWVVYLDIQSINPVVRVRTVDATAFNTLGLSGTAQGDTDSLIYLKAVDQNGTRKADNASEHIKIAVDAGTIEVTELAATVPEPFGSEVLIQTTYDGTNLPLAITTGQQIS